MRISFSDKLRPGVSLGAPALVSELLVLEESPGELDFKYTNHSLSSVSLSESDDGCDSRKECKSFIYCGTPSIRTDCELITRVAQPVLNLVMHLPCGIFTQMMSLSLYAPWMFWCSTSGGMWSMFRTQMWYLYSMSASDVEDNMARSDIVPVDSLCHWTLLWWSWYFYDCIQWSHSQPMQSIRSSSHPRGYFGGGYWSPDFHSICSPQLHSLSALALLLTYVDPTTYIALG